MMDIFDLVEKHGFGSSPPWLLEASVSEVAIYKVAKARFDEIAEQLKAGRSLPKRQRQLVRTQLSTCAGLNDKYIHKSKTPKLYEWIDQANKVLELISKRSDSSVSQLAQTSKMKRDKLIGYIKELEEECRNFRSVSISTICRELVDNAMITNMSENVATIRRLKLELKASLVREENSDERARKWQKEYDLLYIKYSDILHNSPQIKTADSSAEIKSIRFLIVNNDSE